MYHSYVRLFLFIGYIFQFPKTSSTHLKLFKNVSYGAITPGGTFTSSAWRHILKATARSTLYTSQLVWVYLKEKQLRVRAVVLWEGKKNILNTKYPANKGVRKQWSCSEPAKQTKKAHWEGSSVLQHKCYKCDAHTQLCPASQTGTHFTPKSVQGSLKAFELLQ